MPATFSQLKVTLQGIDPPIWRRFLVPDDYSLRDLHRVLQTVMGWEDYHLYQFVQGRTYYAEPNPEANEPAVKRAHLTKMRRVLPKEGSTVRYEYDFGDGWQHLIELEQILPNDEGLNHPVCLAGARACPPEDCGGVSGYEELLEILADPADAEYEERLEWVGGAFDPEAFDLDQVNERLLFYRRATTTRR